MTQKNHKNSEGVSVATAVAVGAGVLAASAGAYYLAGPDGKKHQKKVLKMINKTEKEISHGVKSVIEKGKDMVTGAVETVKEVIKNNSEY